MWDMCHDAAGKTELGFSMAQVEQQDTSISYILWYCFQGHMDWKHSKTWETQREIEDQNINHS